MVISRKEYLLRYNSDNTPPDNFWRSSNWVKHRNSKLVFKHSVAGKESYNRYAKSEKRRAAIKKQNSKKGLDDDFKKSIYLKTRISGLKPDFSNFEERFKIWLEAKQEKKKWQLLLQKTMQL